MLMQEIHDILSDYEQKDIYNMDETGLYWKRAPNFTLATEQPKGIKQDKSRITALMCGNADGNEKTPVWFIGYYENPRCFKGITRDTLGCMYRWNSKVWNNSLIMQEWLLWFQKRVGQRRVALLLDNFSAHECTVAELEDEGLYLQFILSGYLLEQHPNISPWIKELSEPGKRIIVDL